MLIDFRSPGEFSEQNETLAEALKLAQDAKTARFYANTAHALAELALGLAKHFPLKKKIYYFADINPIFAAALFPLAKEGIQLQALDLAILKSPEAWTASLNRDDLFVLYCVDDPILGKLFPVGPLEKALANQNIVKLRLSHSQHFYNADDFRNLQDRGKTSISIYGLSNGAAFGVLGERVSIAPITSQHLNFAMDLETELKWINTTKKCSRASILQFEQHNAAGAKPLFSQEELRTYDRVVVYWEDMDGAAFIDRLAEKLDIQLERPGFENRIETMSVSRWGGVSTLDFLKSYGLSSEMIRGLIILDPDFLQAPNFAQKFVAAREEILREQSGGK